MKDRFYLPHIDGLRSIAVLAVIIYHFNENLLQGGYLGVDIFFVISGFVITGYLLRLDCESSADFYVNFYLKRLKRLTPALLFCLIVTVTLFLLLTTRPSIEIFYTASFASFGLSNIFLWFSAADYFSIDTALNPFTHTWSLGIEEQFYLFYPLLLSMLGLIGAAKKNRFAIYILSAITAISFACFIVLSYASPEAGFYLLPSRMWELGFGCLSYIAFDKGYRTKSYLVYFGLGVLLLSIFLPSSFKTFTTFTACIATALFLLMGHKGYFYKILISKPMIGIGLLSYSLYLWHWPTLVLSKYILGTGFIPSCIAVLTLITLSLFSYFVIEKPLRHKRLIHSPKAELIIYILVILFIAMTLAKKAPLFGSAYNQTLSSFFNIQPAPKWVVDCHGARNLSKKDAPYKECLSVKRTNQKKFAVYLLGDSHAAQLTFMFKKALANTQYQLKFINDEKTFPYSLIKGSVNAKSLEYVVNMIQPGDIVAIAFHRGHFNTDRDKHIALTKKIEMNSKANNFLEGFSHYADEIVRNGGRLLFIRDTPLMNLVMTSSSCRLQSEIMGSSSCRVFIAQDMHTRARQDMVYNHLIEDYPGSCIWDPSVMLYQGEKYFDVVNYQGEYMMTDWNHITKLASENLAVDFKFTFLKCVQ